MREELERAIRELEAKLPELRHLIAESELEMTLASEVQTTAALLLRALNFSNEIGSELRRALLGASGLLSSVESPAVPATNQEGGEVGRHDHEIQEMDRLLSALLLRQQGSARGEPTDDPPGGSVVPAVPRGPSATRTPGAERTYEEAEEPPRNP